MSAIFNPFKTEHSPVSEHALFWHHLAPAQKAINLLKPIDLEMRETVSDNRDIRFWHVDISELLTSLNRIRDRTIEEELGFSYHSLTGIVRGLESQKELNESSGLPFIEQTELDLARERIDKYKLVEECIPTVQDALNERFGDPNSWARMPLDEANELWESDPMSLQQELLYNAEAEPNKRSSNVYRAEYDKVNKTLDVSFANGSSYRYYGVPKDIALGLKKAESKGSFINLNLRNGGFKFERLG